MPLSPAPLTNCSMSRGNGFVGLIVSGPTSLTAGNDDGQWEGRGGGEKGKGEGERRGGRGEGEGGGEGRI